MQVEEFKDYIKNLSISQVINQYLPLKKRGANFEAICPFHDDSNPSLKVNDSKGIYKCFVCGEAGDAIRFVEQFKGLNFIEALKDLSEIFQVSLELAEKKKRPPKYDVAIRVLTSAAKIYFNYASKTQPPPYLNFLKTRNIAPETRENFQIGFAPSDNIITKYLLKKSEENPKAPIMKTALEIGLIKIGRNNRHYDTFRSRIMFPIWDQNGEVRGFGSRAIEQDQIPKYLNSGESFIFDKKNLSFGLNFAKTTIRERDRIILTEGYMDSIMLYQEGFAESLAIMGIAITDEKAKSLSYLSKNIFLAFDNDKAGGEAALRAHNAFIKQGILPRKISLAPHKDPDDFLKAEGKLEFFKRIDDSKAVLDLLIEKSLSQNFGENTDLKIAALHNIFTILSPLKEDLRATERLVNAMKSLGIKTSREDVLQSYRNFLKELSQQNTNKKQFQAKNTNKIEFETAQAKNVPKKKFEFSKIDKFILTSLFQLPEISRESEFTEMLDFATNNDTTKFVNMLLVDLKDNSELKNLVSEILNENEDFSDEFSNFVFSCLFSVAETESFKKEDYLPGLKKRLHQKLLAQKKEHLISKRSQLTKKEEIEKVDQEINQLITQYRDLNN